MLYKNKYRIESIRLRQWDYRSVGWYFITICTKNRLSQPFGHINNGYMCLSPIGQTAYQYWYDIPEHFWNVSLDTFVIMPDHMHGIMRIERNDPVETLHATSLHANGYAMISPQPISLPVMIRSYKSAVTRWAHTNNENDFHWQPRYYDRIIRTERELQNVRQYILNNPKNWAK